MYTSFIVENSIICFVKTEVLEKNAFNPTNIVQEIDNTDFVLASLNI